MFGYLLGAIVGLLLLGLCVLAFSGGRPGRGRRDPDTKPVQAEEPSADAPTPDRSSTATSGEVASSRKHTPPA